MYKIRLYLYALLCYLMVLLASCSKVYVYDGPKSVSAEVEKICKPLTEDGASKIIAILHFDKNQTQLTSEHIAILNEVYLNYKDCNKNITIFGHASNKENPDPFYTYQISRDRAYITMKHLVSLGVNQDALTIFACSDSKPRFFHAKKASQNVVDTTFMGNQRIEIVMFDTVYFRQYSICTQ